ncbi:hypothetical protein A9Q90_04915 [Gammaproteobacteria bacterium 54_18_T64]|nr:hypothetical protein A9Q90_04915 [Gammaproteobacteria bacterium 54_18_T64]
MLQTLKILPKLSLMAIIACSLSACSENKQSEDKQAQPKSTGYQAPRNSQGHPDLQGVWDFRTLTPLERPKELGDKAVFTAEEQAAFKSQTIDVLDVDKDRDDNAATDSTSDVESAYNNFWFDYGTSMNEDRRTSLITDPANGRLPPLTEEAVARMKQNHLREYPVRDILSIGLEGFLPAGPETLGLSERCLLSFNAGPPLTPSAYNNNLRIIQSPKHVVIFTEMIHDARVVPIDDSPHLPAEMSKWTGDSRGHWEGDTLVVETTNFTGKTPTFQMPINLVDPAMNGVVGTGENFTLVERFTRTSDAIIVYEYTVTDLSTFSQAFTVTIPLKASDSQLFEYACHEGNHGAAGMLSGARQVEKEAAEKL